MRTAGTALGAAVLASMVSVALASPEAPARPDSRAGQPAGDPADPEVVGGDRAAAGKWNDAAAVFFGDYPGCTGTLIAPDLVLTAGHCIGGVNQVTLGTSDWTSVEGETIPVVDQIAYPGGFGAYDIGILLLERASTYAPRLLATGCVIERYLENDAPVAIVGFGAIDEDGSEDTNFLMEAQSVVTDFDCTGGRGCNDAVSPDGELGAGGNHIDSCFGDSGGPLYLLTPTGDFLVGVTSRGYDDSSTPCGDGGIYVRPDAVIDWIETESGQTLPRATCNSAPAPGADATQLEVEAGQTVTARVSANDPDGADTHTYTVTTDPTQGVVVIDADGAVHYTAAEDADGVDSFAVDVVDSGVPSLSGRVEFAVTVAPEEDGCGCRAVRPEPGVALLLVLSALLPLRRRRRR